MTPVNSKNKNNNMLNRFYATLLGLGFTFLSAQNEAPKNWFHLDLKQDGIPGLSTESLYNRLKNSSVKKGEQIVVAVIDSGVDSEHEDLKQVMWVNPGEIPGDGLDNDKNGYIDDIHGWNFIGNAKGENVHHDNLEITRLYAAYKKEFEKTDPKALSGKNKKRYDQFKEMEEKVLEERKKLNETFPTYKALKEAVSSMTKQLGKETGITAEDLEKVQPGPDQMLARLVQILKSQMAQGASFEGFLKQLNSAYEYFDGRLNYNYNPDYDPRVLIGDRYEDVSERYYGNNDVKGPDADHGTHVAGIIGATRNNQLGIDGVADNVRIMSVRTVPDGDERDKDVANAIRYAVDNGAKVVNMSFGKGYSPYQKAVDEAIRYAAKKDVLLVHAAGNDGSENDGKNNFPNAEFSRRGLFAPKFASNWLEVGAANWEGNEKLAADFSNYSGSRVDLFSPGVDIYSTVVGSGYSSFQGTSMAAPMAAGAAALLRSYFPDLSAVQIKKILMESTIKQNQMVVKPGTEDEKVPFSSLSISGGILNVEKAFEMAMVTPGKNTSVKRVFSPNDLPSKKVVVP
jgi:subtilisin family serine protease